MSIASPLLSDLLQARALMSASSIANRAGFVTMHLDPSCRPLQNQLELLTCQCVSSAVEQHAVQYESRTEMHEPSCSLGRAAPILEAAAAATQTATTWNIMVHARRNMGPGPGLVALVSSCFVVT